MALHNETGRHGEELAVRYLLDHGYCIRDRNWVCGKFELDIVAEKDGELVFVEVKLRSSDACGDPFGAVDRRKRGRILFSADAYIRTKETELPARFDIISIVKEADRFRVEHIEDAFSPVLRSR